MRIVVPLASVAALITELPESSPRYVVISYELVRLVLLHTRV